MIYVKPKDKTPDETLAIIYSPFDYDRAYDLQRWVRCFATKKIAAWTPIFIIVFDGSDCLLGGQMVNIDAKEPAPKAP